MNDAQSLRYFLGAYEAGSFTRAAEAMGLRQPTVSAAILKLEERYGTRLFERSRQGLRPTRKGRDLYDQVAPLLAELDRIESRMLEKAPAVLRIFCQPDILLAPYASALQGLQRSRGEITLQFSETAEQSDAAFVSDQCVPQRFRFFALKRERYGVAVAQNHPLALLDEVPAGALAAEQLIGRPYCPLADTFQQEIAAQRGQSACHNAVHDHQVLDLVRAGIGVALVPRDHAGTVRGVKWLRLAGQAPVRQIGVAVRRNSHAHALAETLIAALPEPADS